MPPTRAELEESVLMLRELDAMVARMLDESLDVDENEIGRLVNTVSNLRAVEHCLPAVFQNDPAILAMKRGVAADENTLAALVGRARALPQQLEMVNAARDGLRVHISDAMPTLSPPDRRAVQRMLES